MKFIISDDGLKNISLQCFSADDRILKLSANPVEHIIIGYLALIVIIFGVIGNLINLSVLTAPGYSNRSNVFLASLAICDMLCLLLFLPHSLAHYQFFYLNETFRYFYINLKMIIHFLSNWTSALAIWFVLIVCMERLIVIRYPLKARTYGCISVKIIILMNVIITGLLTFYNFFTYDCYVFKFCSGKQPYQLCTFIGSGNLTINSKRFDVFYTNTNPKWLIDYIQINGVVNVFLVIVIPICVITVSNFLLIMTLRERRTFLLLSAHDSSRSVKSSKTSNGSFSVEHKVGLTVCAIVSSFVITQAPSAIIELTFQHVIVGQPKHPEIRAVTTFMIILGKSLNFILFCLSSSGFRQRLFVIMRNRLSITKTGKSPVGSEVNTNFTLVTDSRKSTAGPVEIREQLLHEGARLISMHENAKTIKIQKN